MILTFLGTGTSTGVPQLRCKCKVCTSADPRDNRLRCSAMLQSDEQAPAVLLDCGPDFREQMLREGSPDLAAVLLTHSHYDHVGGIDDLRPYTHTFPGRHFPVYCRADVAQDLRDRVPYCFRENPYPGVPQFDLRIIKPGDEFVLETGAGNTQLHVEALEIIHGRLPILGYRIGPVAYITDASQIPDDTLQRLKGIDTLVINALRHEEHPSHQNLSHALGVINLTKPRKAYLIHMSHEIGLHEVTVIQLPKNVTLAYDGLKVRINNYD
ncbi:MAG: MBL fold metallo-hydrolase [Muribaculaceae bacterium]|nr:MBL fold metallo-hydrolase [Muribaculaceae bacterium]